MAICSRAGARRRRRRRNSEVAQRDKHRDYFVMSEKNKRIDSLTADISRTSRHTPTVKSPIVALDLSNDTLNTTLTTLNRTSDTPTLVDNELSQNQSNIRVTRVNREDKPKALVNSSRQNSEENKEDTSENDPNISNEMNDRRSSIGSSATTKIIDISIVQLPRNSPTDISENDTLVRSARSGSVSVTRTNTRAASAKCSTANPTAKSYKNINVTKVDRRLT